MQPVLAASAPDLTADAPAGPTGADTPAPAFTALLAQKMQAESAPAATQAQTAEGTAPHAEAGEGHDGAARDQGQASAPGADAPGATPGPETALVAALWRSVRAVGVRVGTASAPATAPAAAATPAPSVEVHLVAGEGEKTATVATPLPDGAPDIAPLASGDDVHAAPGTCAAPETAKDAAVTPAGTAIHVPTERAERSEVHTATAPAAAPALGDAAANGPLVLPHARPAVIVEPPAARPDTGTSAGRGDARRARFAAEARDTASAPIADAREEAAPAETPAVIPPAGLAAGAVAPRIGPTPVPDGPNADAADATTATETTATPTDDARAGGTVPQGSVAAMAAMAGMPAPAGTIVAAQETRRPGVDGDAAAPRGGRAGTRASGDGDRGARRLAGASADSAQAVVPSAARTVADDAARIELLGEQARVTELVVERDARVTSPRAPAAGAAGPAVRAADVHTAASDSAGAPATASSPARVDSLAELDAPARRLGEALHATRSGARAALPTRDPAAPDIPSPAAPRPRVGSGRVLADSRDGSAPRPAREEAAVTPARADTSAHVTATSARAAQAAADASAPMATARASAPAVAAPTAPIAGTAEAPATPVPVATDRITVKLGDEAGAPSIRVAIRGDRVDARIITSDGALARSLETGSHELSASLQAQGFGESRVQVRGTPSALDGAGLANLAGSAPSKAPDAGAQQGEGERRSPEQRHQERFEDRPRQQQGRDGKRRLDEEER